MGIKTAPTLKVLEDFLEELDARRPQRWAGGGGGRFQALGETCVFRVQAVPHLAWRDDSQEAVPATAGSAASGGAQAQAGGTEWWTLGGRVQAWTWSPPGCGGSPSCLQWHFLHLSKLFSSETYMAT